MKNWITICVVSAVVSALFFSPSDGSEPEAPQPQEDAPESVLSSAHYTTDQFGEGEEVLVGRLVLHRRFAGTRADPPYRDHVRFRFFDGSELPLLTFADGAVEQEMVEQLKAGRSVPAVVSARFERVRVGHDGLNVGYRITPRLEACVPSTVEVLCAAAKEAGLDASACEAFADAVEPDVLQDGVAVSLDRINVRPKVLPQWKTAAVFLNGIRVFNTTAKDATIEIVGLTIEQAGTSQVCSFDEEKSLRSWKVRAQSWADGVYTDGEMPKNRWTFEPTKPIDPSKPVNVQLELKINGGEKVTLKRTVEPMTLKK